jgi:hypothetical protein
LWPLLWRSIRDLKFNFAKQWLNVSQTWATRLTQRRDSFKLDTTTCRQSTRSEIWRSTTSESWCLFMELWQGLLKLSLSWWEADSSAYNAAWWLNRSSISNSNLLSQHVAIMINARTGLSGS